MPAVAAASVTVQPLGPSTPSRKTLVGQAVAFEIATSWMSGFTYYEVHRNFGEGPLRVAGLGITGRIAFPNWAAHEAAKVKVPAMWRWPYKGFFRFQRGRSGWMGAS